jgi:hypothetical protein
MPIGMIAFPPISPSPVRDFRAFDFTKDINPPISGYFYQPAPVAPASIMEAIWSGVTDPAPSDRMIGPPVFDVTTTSQLIGDCVDGCTYALSAQVKLSDGRILVKNGTLVCLSAETQAENATANLPPGVLAFDYDEWLTKYPEFSQVPEPQAEGFWLQAGIIFRNDLTSPEWDPVVRRDILDTLTAHLAMVLLPPPLGRGGISGMVGPISSKSVNGVSVSSSGIAGFSGMRAWYASTPYGLKYLALTAAYRTFHYIPGPQRFASGVRPYWYGWPQADPKSYT